MKAICCFLSIFLAQTFCNASETAYEALRLLSAQRGQKILSSVIELRGSGGVPQPGTWKIVLDDPMARGGVREFEIAEGKVLSERTPVSTFVGVNDGTIIDVQKLNLDSSGAFTVAEAEARRQKIGFDAVDYILRRSETSGMPEWVLRLQGEGKGTVGTVHIAADTGAVVLVESATPGLLEEPKPSTGTAPALEERAAAVGRTLGKFGSEVRDRAYQGAIAVKEFFTGTRTITGRKVPEEPAD